MSSKYKVLVFIAFLLIVVSLASSFSTYKVAINTMETQLKNSTLPLSIDNIYNDIQKTLLEPSFIASLMANDTFVHDWIASGEKDDAKMTRYLKNFQEKYTLLSAFFVSQKSKKYYSHKGVLYKVDNNHSTNEWYYDFTSTNQTSEINLDTNTYFDKGLIFFINKKIINEGRLLGVCGTAVKISNIQQMLEHFRSVHHFNVFFMSKQGDVVIHNKSSTESFIDDPSHFEAIKQGQQFHYTKEGVKHLSLSRYIDELHLYVVIEVNIEEFIQKTKLNLYVDIFVTLLVAVLVLTIIVLTLNRYQNRVERLANYDSLTSLANRRTFNMQFEKYFAFSKRNDKALALLFIDIDDFKLINDTLGHMIGDEVLKRMAALLDSAVRGSDVVARWGGEEFALLLEECAPNKAEVIAEKLRKIIHKDEILKQLVAHEVTISIGVTCLLQDDTMDTILKRADAALYRAKAQGKNQTVLFS